MDLEDERKQAADFAFENYDFGDITVSEAGHWDTSEAENFTRLVTADNAEGEKVELNFHVRFDCLSAEAQEAYALDRETGDMM